MSAAINDKFGAGSVLLTQNSTAFLNLPVLAANGVTVDEVASFVGTLTKGQTFLEGSKYTQAEANDKLFSAAFPSRLLPELPCIQNAPLN